MSESGAPDLGRIINLIMENPKLIEEISNLAKNEGQKEETKPQAASPVAPPEKSEVTASVAQMRTHSRRGELLSLLKPYLSEKRASAIDSMVSVADVLKMMKRGD